MDIELDASQSAITLGLLVSALNEAERDGRSGPWVDRVRDTLSAFNRAENQASWKVHPTGGEAFGTRVTYWSQSWGNRHAVITNAPRPAAGRGRFDSADYQIMIKGSGMTHVPAEMLTLGWHLEAEQ